MLRLGFLCRGMGLSRFKLQLERSSRFNSTFAPTGEREIGSALAGGSFGLDTIEKLLTPDSGITMEAPDVPSFAVHQLENSHSIFEHLKKEEQQIMAHEMGSTAGSQWKTFAQMNTGLASSSVHPIVIVSPIPNFFKWISRSVETRAQLLTKADCDALQRLMPETGSANEALKALLLENNWHMYTERAPLLQGLLMRLCFRYLLKEKHPANGKVALDPVCNFHIQNGAQLQGINWLSDMSPVTMRQSGGMMVKYNYTIPYIEMNAQEYAETGKIAISRQVKDLLKHQI